MRTDLLVGFGNLNTINSWLIGNRTIKDVDESAANLFKTGGNISKNSIDMTFVARWSTQARRLGPGAPFSSAEALPIRCTGEAIL